MDKENATETAAWSFCLATDGIGLCMMLLRSYFVQITCTANSASVRLPCADAHCSQINTCKMLVQMQAYREGANDFLQQEEWLHRLVRVQNSRVILVKNLAADLQTVRSSEMGSMPQHLFSSRPVRQLTRDIQDHLIPAALPGQRKARLNERPHKQYVSHLVHDVRTLSMSPQSTLDPDDCMYAQSIGPPPFPLGIGFSHQRLSAFGSAGSVSDFHVPTGTHLFSFQG
jgi:hypothetical protein